MNFYIKVFGCQYNEWDKTRLAFVLNKFGLTESSEESAEIVFLLNCSVRKTGVDRALGFARNFIDQKKKVVVTGCVLEPDKKRFLEKGAILWDGKDFSKLNEALKLEPTDELQTKNYELKTSLVPIMTGCNNFCSYCAVPYTRGREVSRSVEDILNDVRRAVEAGEKEIVLLGQNVNSYSNDFAKLLEQVNAIPGDFKVKFTSNHPKDMSDDIIEAVATLPKIAKEIHLPLQSGSNKVLQSMNRPYTREQYLDLVSKIKKRIPEIRITTDSIIGFPTETEEDFELTVDVYRQVGFAQAFNNKYSPREGTKAWELGDPIPWAEKQRRWRVLNDISYQKSEKPAIAL
ncbi:MAG: MiaB/RimO family radical SAM methylthiotransferase [Patescibacteria group bacterium]|jgi:tRNA-2-methylthio-N6-dimethylallyladenosine synthase